MGHTGTRERCDIPVRIAGALSGLIAGHLHRSFPRKRESSPFGKYLSSGVLQRTLGPRFRGDERRKALLHTLLRGAGRKRVGRSRRRGRNRDGLREPEPQQLLRHRGELGDAPVLRMSPMAGEADEMIGPDVGVDVVHARVRHGAARVISREPRDDFALAPGRGDEVDRHAVAVHGGRSRRRAGRSRRYGPRRNWLRSGQATRVRPRSGSCATCRRRRPRVRSGEGRADRNRCRQPGGRRRRAGSQADGCDAARAQHVAVAAAAGRHHHSRSARRDSSGPARARALDSAPTRCGLSLRRQRAARRQVPKSLNTEETVWWRLTGACGSPLQTVEVRRGWSPRRAAVSNVHQIKHESLGLTNKDNARWREAAEAASATVAAPSTRAGAQRESSSPTSGGRSSNPRPSWQSPPTVTPRNTGCPAGAGHDDDRGGFAALNPSGALLRLQLRLPL